MERKYFLVRLPAEEHTALRNLAFFTGQPMNEIVCTALRNYLATDGRTALRDASTAHGRAFMRDLLDKLADS